MEKLSIYGVTKLLKETRNQVRMKISKRIVLHDIGQRRKRFRHSKKNEQVEGLVEKLHNKHNGNFTTLQLRLRDDGGSWK